MTVLVLGARPSSLGSAVRDNLQSGGLHVATAGVSGEEFYCDVTDWVNVRKLMETVRPRQVVATVGMNQSFTLRAEGMRAALHEHLAVNTIGVITCLQEWLEMLDSIVIPPKGYEGFQFVAISSNSAHIARRNSIPYCASKAALSMALRCAARECAGEGKLVYGYEPGLLAGTPMTSQAAAEFTGPLHRMPGVRPEGLSTRDFAATIVANLLRPNEALHGSMIRLDAGEQ